MTSKYLWVMSSSYNLLSQEITGNCDSHLPKKSLMKIQARKKDNLFFEPEKIKLPI